MFNQNTTLFRLFNLILFIIWGSGFIFAQDGTTTVVATEEAPRIMVKSASLSRTEDEDDSKVTGATVRGRLIYEDTNRPLRYAMVTLVSDKETFSTYGSRFVKSDENGEFLIKNVKPGTYVAYVKSEGILNQDSYKFSYRRPPGDEKPDAQFEKIEIGGLGEFQIVVAARRGGAISGRILYADGEAAVGVKVEALRRDGTRYSNVSSAYGSENGTGSTQTDDRGYYRITGLPEGQYLVRVIEPVSHQAAPQYGYNFRGAQGSILRTYYPEGENSKNAKELELAPGQEQTGIDIGLPERRLYGISGRIVKKGSRDPLADFTVSFFKISDRDELVGETYSGNSISSNKAGAWSLKSLPPGKYRISISQGYSYNSEKDGNKKTERFPDMVKEIEITDKNLADVDFEVPAEASISGTIVVEGGKEVPADVRLFAVNDETRQGSFMDYSGQTQTKNPQAAKEKAFHFGKLSEGKYRLLGINQNFYVKSVTLDGRDVLNSPIDVNEGEGVTGVRVVVSTNMGTIKGKVAGYDGGEDAFVLAIDANAVFGQFQRNFNAKLGVGGEFEMKAAPGDYTIFVVLQKDRPQNQEQAKAWFDKLIRDGQKITVKESEATNVTLSMPK